MKFAYIETSTWINAVENDPAFNVVVINHLQSLKRDGWILCISEMVLLELYCKPIKEENYDLLHLYHQIIENTNHIPCYKEMLTESLRIIYTDRLHVSDAIHVAMAKQGSCDLFVTTDKHFKNLTVINPYVIELPKLEILK